MGLGARSVYVFERKGKTAYIGLSFPYAAAAVMYTSGASFLNQYTHTRGIHIYRCTHTDIRTHLHTQSRTDIHNQGRTPYGRTRTQVKAHGH